MTFRDTLYEYFFNKSTAIDNYYQSLVDNFRLFNSDELDYVELLIARTRKNLIDEIQHEVILLSRKIK